MLSARMHHSFNECGDCIFSFPQKVDQCMKSRIPMYAFNILQFNVMVHIVESTRDACTIRPKCSWCPINTRIWTRYLLHKQLGNIVFHVNKRKIDSKRWITKQASLHVKLHCTQIYLVTSCSNVQLKMADRDEIKSI